MSPEHLVLVEDYADLSDDGNDWGPAIQAAFLDNEGRHVLMSAREYVVRSTVLIPSGMLIGAGRGATVIVAAPQHPGQDLIRWLGEDSATGRASGARGLSVVVEGAHRLNVAFHVPPRQDQYSSRGRLVEFTDLMLCGATQKSDGYANTCVEGALVWIQVGDCVSCVIRDVTIWGTFDIKVGEISQERDTGIKLWAAGAVLTARISNVELGHLHTAVWVQEKSFYSLSHFDLMGTYYGLRETGAEVFNEPKVSHGNINAQAAGIWVENTGGRDYDDVTIRRHDTGAPMNHAWYGIYARGVNNLRIHGCTIHPTLVGSGGHTGIYLGDLNDVGCNGIVDGCKFGDNLNDCILIENSAGVIVGNNVLLGAPTQLKNATYLRLENNARRIHVAARPPISSTAAVPNYKLLEIGSNVDLSTLEVDLIASPHTFVPAFKHGSPGYDGAQTGRYVRAGRRVEFELTLKWNSLNTGDTNLVKIELPLPTDTAGSGLVVLNLVLSTGLNLSSGALQPFFFANTARNLLGLATSTGAAANYSRLKAAGQLVLNGWYWTR